MFKSCIKALIFCVLQTAMDRHQLDGKTDFSFTAMASGKTGLTPIRNVDSLVRIAIAG